MSTNDRSVTIIGAGLCGSLLSIILRPRGFEVSVLERRADGRSGEVAAGRSINLAMSSRGIKALQHAGVYEEIEPLLLPMRGRMIHKRGGQKELQRYGQREDELIYSVSRAELNKILIDSAERRHGVEIRFLQEAAVYDPDDRSIVVNNLADASEFSIIDKPIIAADGAGSVVRRAFGDSELISATESLLPHSYKELAIAAGDDGAFRLEKDALHIWPRGEFMLIALPNPGGDFTLTLFMPEEGSNSFAALDDDAKVAAFFEHYFADIIPLIPDLPQMYARNPVGVLGTVRCQHWHVHDNFLLIGDAAHAVVPFHGQGMNLAFEDCVVLDEIMDDFDGDWSKTFEEFESRQIANANAIADMALENYVEMRDTVLDRKHVLRKELSFALERRLPVQFIPQYSMVMFHDEIPYATAQQRGTVQDRLLREFTADAETLSDIDLAAAAAAAAKALPPLK
jgi:kynurenine 3-monooxygenase